MLPNMSRSVTLVIIAALVLVAWFSLTSLDVDYSSIVGNNDGPIENEKQPQSHSSKAPVPAATSSAASSPSAPPKITKENRRFVIVTPATSPDSNLCKFILSATALGYPAPVVITWGWKPEEFSKAKPTLAKLPGIVEYLDAALSKDAHPADRLHPNDVVLFADGLDVWFQLPPDVLLQRYHDINEQANARMRKLWKGKDPMPMKQTILGSAQKACWPVAPYNLRCNLLPESPARKDLYGPNTDKPANPQRPVENRPRYLNGGSYMGTAGDMQRMFRRALFKYEEMVGKGMIPYSEQGITATIFGEQESWRKWRREHADLKTDDALMLGHNTFEFGIGLDYAQHYIVSTSKAPDDGEILAIGNKTAIESKSKDRNISPVRVTGLPDDIKKSPNPLNGLTQSPNWADMPLYVDFYSEAIPAILHHNEYVNGTKNRRITWWDQTWFFPHLRNLLTRELGQLDIKKPLAKYQGNGLDITYYMSESNANSRRPRLFLGNSSLPLPVVEDFGTICQKSETAEAEGFKFPEPLGKEAAEGSELDVEEAHYWYDELFRDGQGPV